MILAIKHIDIEGPGTLGAFLEEYRIPIKVIEIGEGDFLPEDLSQIEAVITLGGPMNVYEEERYPFLKEENIFLKKVIEKEIPLFGICLGAQLIVKALGAEVLKASQEEKGWHPIFLTPEGKKDPLFKGVSSELEVFQWHEDTFMLPKGTELLASSSACPNQSFRFGKNTYGLQFHIEVTDEIIASWIRGYFKVGDPFQHPVGRTMLEQYKQYKAVFKEEAGKVYRNFLNIIS